MEPAIRYTLDPFDQSARRVTEAPAANSKVISLFSGCGGMDLGFLGGFSFAGRHYDRLSCEIVWANDINKAACETYEKNMNHSIHHGDVADLIQTMPEKADVVIGGFPCQDVSINGKGQAGNGTRTILYKVMIEVIQRTKPKVFVAENVKGLVSHEEFYNQMTADFEKLKGYSVSQRIYNAADYGVPQKRERLFIVGVRGKQSFAHPAPTAEPRMTASDALRDLEGEPENHEINHIWSKAAASPEQGSRRLRKDDPATTIRAEHHGNVQWHYALNRRISVREAARLQSFPDEFWFSGGMRETERQVGNAVPPVLAWHLSKSIQEYLDP